jgi:hypothetical protein
MKPWFLMVIALAATGVPAADHHEQNSLFRQLTQAGVPLGPGVQAKLPLPAMADGLSAAQQRRVLQELEGRQADVEELLRRSPVTPFVLHFKEVTHKTNQEPGRAIDLAFVAFGRFDQLTRSDFLDEMLNSGRKDARIQPLPAAAAQARGLKALPGETERTAWAHVSLALMDRVELRGTSRTVWSRTADSILVAAVLEPACTRDPELPNVWQVQQRGPDGMTQPVGPAQPYEALGYYLKITRLHEPADALFVEWHLVYLEPRDWFDGANLLRSKLPIVLQTKIRGFRRELMRALER